MARWLLAETPFRASRETAVDEVNCTLKIEYPADLKKGRLYSMSVKDLPISPQNLKIAMANKKYNVADLAEHSGVSRISIGKYLSGKRNPRPKTLGKIACALDVSAADIIDNKAAATADNSSK